MTEQKVIPILTTGIALIVPPGKIKPIPFEVRHVVPVQVRAVVLSEVPSVVSIKKGRTLDPIRMFEGRYYRIMPVGLHTIDVRMHEALAKENPETCPTWRKDECAWKKQVPALDEIPARRIVDDGWQSAGLRAQAMADRWLAFGGSILQEVPKPCLRVRFDPHTVVGKEIRVETVADRMPTRRLSVRFPLTEETRALRVAQRAFDRVYGRANQRPMQAMNQIRIDRPDLMPEIGVAEFGEDLEGAINDMSEKGALHAFDADRLEAFADLRGMLERGLTSEEVSEAFDLYVKASTAKTSEMDAANGLERGGQVGEILFGDRLGTLAPAPARSIR